MRESGLIARFNRWVSEGHRRPTYPIVLDDFPSAKVGAGVFRYLDGLGISVSDPEPAVISSSGRVLGGITFQVTLDNGSDKTLYIPKLQIRLLGLWSEGQDTSPGQYFKTIAGPRLKPGHLSLSTHTNVHAYIKTGAPYLVVVNIFDNKRTEAIFRGDPKAAA